MQFLESDDAPVPVAVQVNDADEHNEPSIQRKLKRTDAMVVRGFLGHLEPLGYSPATTARKIATLRSFYKWMTRQGIIDTNPDAHDPHAQADQAFAQSHLRRAS